MKGGAAAAEVAFTAAQIQWGPAPLLHEAYVAALAKASAIPQVRLRNNSGMNGSPAIHVARCSNLRRDAWSRAQDVVRHASNSTVGWF